MASIYAAAATPPRTAFGSPTLPLQGRVSALRGRVRAPQGRVRAWLLVHQTLESPRQHFAHHAEIITRRDVRGFDVELAVLILTQALRSGDDHGADRVGALNMTVVVDLDAARRPCQPEGPGERGKEPLLGRRLGKLAAERLAGVGERVLDDVALAAPARHQELHFAVALDGERLRQQFAVLDLLRQQDEAWTRLVVVELREKRAQYLAGSERPVGARKIGAIAPVLAGAKEEYLDAEKAAVLEDRENIRLLDIARIDVLVRLHGRQRREPIAQYGGALEIERLGRLVHFACEIFLYGAAPARQELLRLPHQLVIGGARYLARAGRRAALDLVEQARPGAAVEHGIRAGQDQEGALQRRDSAVHRVDRRERPEIVAVAVARP